MLSPSCRVQAKFYKKLFSKNQKDKILTKPILSRKEN